MSVYRPPGQWRLSEDDGMDTLVIMAQADDSISGLMMNSTTGGLNLFLGTWDGTTGQIGFTRVGVGFVPVRVYLGSLLPLNSWPVAGEYVLFGQFANLDGSGGGPWSARINVIP
jgi:hypothetical protein